MKKIILLFVFSMLSFTVNAQTSKELIGKWQLVKWTKNDKDKDIKKIYKTDQVFQVFKEDGVFESVIGDKTHKGKWKLSSDNKKLSISVLIEDIDFTIDYFDADKRIISANMIGVLEYKKITE